MHRTSNHLAEWVGQVVCTEEEMQTVWETVQKMVKLLQNVRREGLLCLEDAADEESDVFLRSCLRYITETDPTPEELREYVQIWLGTASVSAGRKLEMAVIGDGLEQILKHSTPIAAMRRLGAWLGTAYADRVEMTLSAWKREQHGQTKQSQSLEPTFDCLLAVSDEEFCTWLAQTDERLLALALIGASSAVVERVRLSIPVEKWTQLEQQKRIMAHPRKCDVQQAQTQILEQLFP